MLFFPTSDVRPLALPLLHLLQSAISCELSAAFSTSSPPNFRSSRFSYELSAMSYELFSALPRFVTSDLRFFSTLSSFFRPQTSGIWFSSLSHPLLQSAISYQLRAKNYISSIVRASSASSKSGFISSAFRK